MTDRHVDKTRSCYAFRVKIRHNSYEGYKPYNLQTNYVNLILIKICNALQRYLLVNRKFEGHRFRERFKTRRRDEFNWRWDRLEGPTLWSSSRTISWRRSRRSGRRRRRSGRRSRRSGRRRRWSWGWLTTSTLLSDSSFCIMTSQWFGQCTKVIFWMTVSWNSSFPTQLRRTN